MKGLLSGFISNNDMSRRFYGDKKIETAQEDGERVTLVFSDGTSLNLSKKLFEVSVSRESLDPTQLWDKQLAPIAKETLELWLSWDIQLEQIDYLHTLLKSSTQYNLRRAETKLFGKELKDMRFSDVDKILLKPNE